MFWLIYLIIAWCLRAAMVPVVLRRQMAPGASLAWLGIVFLHPYIGVLLYLFFGETRLGRARAEEHRQLVCKFRTHSTSAGADPRPPRAQMPPPYQPMVLQAEKISGMPILPGNSAEFLGTSPIFVDRLVADIEKATTTIHLLYYMYAVDDTSERVTAALCAAAKRGVRCRLLADAVASRTFLRFNHLQQRLAQAGIEVAAALPVDLFRRRLPRMDLRNHRKLAIIDGRIAYAGSHNLIDPDYGGRRGHPWIDVTARLAGPVVDELAVVFQEDWAFETGQQADGPTVYDLTHPAGDIPMQVVPTGPSAPDATYRRVLLAAIQCARTKLILTTPYFVPDETTIVSLMMAADRGVEVTLILPKTPDHLFTAAAGRAHYTRLMSAGIAIHLFRPGLIHSKTTSVDDAFALFGSANVDVRSFNLNFELSILLYGPEITHRLRAVQNTYLADSDRIDPAEWAKRSVLKRYTDGAISLLSPLL